MRTRAWLPLLAALFLVPSRAVATGHEAKVKAPLVRQIEWEGNVALSSSTLGARIPLKPGKPLVSADLKYSLNMVDSMYRDKGYYQVNVSTRTTAIGTGDADVRFLIQEGPVYSIGRISVQGNRNISERIILRELNIHTGDLFSQSKIFEGNRQLYMTGYFSSIDFTYSTSTAHVVDIGILVQERATHFLKGVVGYGSQTKEGVTLGYEDMNFLGNARKLDISATHSGFLTEPRHYRTTLLQTNLTQPHIFNSPYEAQMNVAREYDNREAYDSYSTSSRFGVGRRYSPAITASLRYRYQGTRVTRVDIQAQTPGFTNVSAVGPTFAYDNTNDPFLPTIGWRVLGTYEEGLRFFAGDVRFHKLEGRLGRFDRPVGQWVFFEGLQAAQILPDSTSDRDIIPIYERYFLGGANSVRGYSERELGPRDSSGKPLGGNAFLVGNFEVRHPLYKKLWGVVFIDGGQLYPTDPGERWPHVRLKRLDDLLYGAGSGLRWNTPVGAVRLELGYKLNPTGGTGFMDRAAIHFSIGEVF